MTLNHRNKFSKLGKLFRSKSEQAFKSPSQSPSSSPKNSPSAPPRRRLLRVIRDNQSEGEEWENPHVVRRYTQQYWEKQMEEARALQHSVSLPYDVNTDQSILKKNTSTESDNDANGATSGNDTSSPTFSKRASFREEVEVIEFCSQEKIVKHAHYVHEAKLGQSDEEVFNSDCDDSFKELEKKEHHKEFQLAKQNSFDEDDEALPESERSDSFGSDSFNRDTLLESVSDSGAMSDESGCCSDNDMPKKKTKKRRLHLRVKFADSSNDSDKENDTNTSPQPTSKSRSYSKTISKFLHRVHLDRDRDSNSSGCEDALSVIKEH